MALTLTAGRADGRTPAASSALWLQVLGPVRAWRNGLELDPGPRQQTYLFAVLLAGGGQPIGTSELVDLIWGDDVPASAVNVIHKYVGALRRLLEPDLPRRHAGGYLIRSSNGYACAAGPEALDLARFRQAVVAARTARADGDEDVSLDHYVAALGLWNGPAGSGMSHGSAAAAVFAGLDEEFFAACVEASRVASACGHPERILPALRVAAAMAPLHEPVQASLVASLGAAGHQAEALSRFDRTRRRLADDLGIDPGAELVAAHRQVLGQSRTRPAASVPLGRVVETPTAVPPLVGRSSEITALERAITPALHRGTAVVLLEGEPGAGKTRLIEEVTRGPADRGALVLWGHGLPGAGVPTMWPWVEMVTALLDTRPADRREHYLAGEVGRLAGAGSNGRPPTAAADGTARFRLLEEIAHLVAEAAADRPVLLVMDDLQWADASTLQVLEHLGSHLPNGAALVGALRNRGPSVSAELAGTLAALSRTAAHRRLLLRPLAEQAVAELIAAETGYRPSAELAQLVHERTGGNAFFTRELARLLAEGAGSVDAVLRGGLPTTVRDVVRSRLSELDADVRRLVELAALIGREVELTLLARAASVDELTCLDRLEPARALGVFSPDAANPSSCRFTHDLVRQAVGEAIPAARAAALHGRIADAVEAAGRRGEAAVERLAQHLWAAGPAVDSARTVAALIEAGRRAAGKTALAEAERFFEQATELARKASLLDLELAGLSHLTAVVGMRSMYGTVSADLLERAETVARRLGRDRDAAGFLFSRWTAHVQRIDLHRSRTLAARLRELARDSEDPLLRMYGEAAWSIQHWEEGEIGRSFRRMRALRDFADSGREGQRPDPVSDGLRLLIAGMFAEISAYHGEAASARTMLGHLLDVAGADPYAVTVATGIAARTAAVVGDPAWSLAVAERGVAADPQFVFVFLGTYLRLARCWGQAMLGRDPGRAADEAERLIVTNLMGPVRSDVATWFALLAQMRLATGAVDAAAAALDRAENLQHRHGQRAAAALILLIRAEVTVAAGDPEAARRLAERARAVAVRAEAFLFQRRADRFIAGLTGAGESPRILQSPSTAGS